MSFLREVWRHTLSCCSQTSFGLVEYRPIICHVWSWIDWPNAQWLQVSTWLIRNSQIVSPQLKESSQRNSILAEVSFILPHYRAGSSDFIQTAKYSLSLSLIDDLLRWRYWEFPRIPSGGVYLWYGIDEHQQNVNRSGSNTHTSQTLWLTSLVLLSTSRCSQAPLQLGKVFSEFARTFSGAHKRTWSDGGAFKMLSELTCRTVKFLSSWDLCATLQETWCRILTEVVHMVPKPQAISSIIFVFVTVTRFATS